MKMNTTDLQGKTAEELVTLVLSAQQNIDAKDIEILALNEELSGTIKANASLTLQIEEMTNAAPVVIKTTEPTNAISKETFKVDGNKYGFKKLQIFLRDNLITATEVLASEDLQKELVKIGSGFIYQLPGQK